MNDYLVVSGLVIGVNGLSLGVVCYAVKKIINSNIENLIKKVERERESRITVDNELWEAINSHGHKGLDLNGSRVTR